MLIFQEPIFKLLGTTVRTPLDTKTAPSARVTAVEGQGTRPRTPSNDGNYNTPSFRQRRAASWADLGSFETRSSGVGTLLLPLAIFLLENEVVEMWLFPPVAVLRCPFFLFVG